MYLKGLSLCLDHGCWKQMWAAENQIDQTRTKIVLKWQVWWCPNSLEYFISCECIWKLRFHCRCRSNFLSLGYKKTRLNGNWVVISFKLLIWCVFSHINQIQLMKRPDIIPSRSYGAVKHNSSAWGDCLELTMPWHFVEFLAILESFLQRSRAKPPVSLHCLLAANKPINYCKKQLRSVDKNARKGQGRTPPVLVFNPISLEGRRGSGELWKTL